MSPAGALQESELGPVCRTNCFLRNLGSLPHFVERATL